jgi:hypothetical protein
MDKELQNLSFFKDIFKSSLEGILVVNADAILVKANPAAKNSLVLIKETLST